jgi:hypothetical protein
MCGGTARAALALIVVNHRDLLPRPAQLCRAFDHPILPPGAFRMALAREIPEWRRGPVRHSLETLVRQRLLQTACGYEDQNDATTLRHDPLLKLVCGRLPADGNLASQPTLSRLENAVNATTCYQLAAALVQVDLHQRHESSRILQGKGAGGTV